MGKDDIKDVNLEGMDEDQYNAMSRGGEDSIISNEGTAGSRRVEAIPNFIPFDTDEWTCNENNAWVVLTRDRPGNIASGYGGKGDTQAGAIDLVVGRQGSKPKSDSWANPNFRTDSARVYISQKCNIDQYFGCTTEGYVGDSRAKSGVGIKADGIRLVARESVKIVTTTDVVNSWGKQTESSGLIELIAGNTGNLLEPVPKGWKLVKALSEMNSLIADLAEAVNGFVTYQMAFNTSLASHTHQCAGPWGAPTALPSFEATAAGQIANQAIATRTVPSISATFMNGPILEFTHLNPFGENFILSEGVYTT
tara:strand:+ start:891 stop:1817 length:927 start_codon:yes stop_codon:yes gene_type:complete